MSGGGIAAVATAGLGGAILQGYEANKSRQAAGQAYNAGINSLNSSQNQALGYLNPYDQAGQTALSPLTGLLTGNQYDPTTGQTTTLTPDQRDQLLYQSPGYKFSLDQTTQALQKQQAAEGITLSGGGQKELAQYVSGLSSQYSNDYINQLSQLAGIGQNAANAEANTVNNFGSQIAGYTTNQGLTNANYYQQLGNIFGSTASQIGGAAAAQNNYYGNGLSSGSGSSSNFSSVGNGQYNNGQFINSGAGYLSPNTALQYNAPLIAGG